jgi:hypothetical protein
MSALSLPGRREFYFNPFALLFSSLQQSKSSNYTKTTTTTWMTTTMMTTPSKLSP